MREDAKKVRVGPRTGVGVGIHTGEVVLGSVGIPQRSDFTAIGDTVNTAARIQGELTKQFGVEIVLSGETVERLGPNSSGRIATRSSRSARSWCEDGESPSRRTQSREPLARRWPPRHRRRARDSRGAVKRGDLRRHPGGARVLPETGGSAPLVFAMTRGAIEAVPRYKGIARVLAVLCPVRSQSFPRRRRTPHRSHSSIPARRERRSSAPVPRTGRAVPWG